MYRSALHELHYITPIKNVPSILKLGLLSHNGSKEVPHDDLSMSEIQDLRAKITVPGGLRLHDYVNLYINARNPMMFIRRASHTSVSVLRISTDVLDLPDVVVTGGNASSDYTRFAAAPAGLAIVDEELVFARSWRSNDQIDYYRRKSAICAEVLVPHRLDPNLIVGAHLSCLEARDELAGLAPGLACGVTPGLFFR